jgi:uncharacterized protein YqgQ
VKSEENEDYYLELQKLKSLLDAGILTKEEFERTKAAILSKF